MHKFSLNLASNDGHQGSYLHTVEQEKIVSGNLSDFPPQIIRVPEMFANFQLAEVPHSLAQGKFVCRKFSEYQLFSSTPTHFHILLQVGHDPKFGWDKEIKKEKDRYGENQNPLTTSTQYLMDSSIGLGDLQVQSALQQKWFVGDPTSLACDIIMRLHLSLTKRGVFHHIRHWDSWEIDQIFFVKKLILLFEITLCIMRLLSYLIRFPF